MSDGQVARAVRSSGILLGERGEHRSPVYPGGSTSPVSG